MRPVRLLHIHHGRVDGGAPRSLLRLLTALDPGRFESRVVVPGRGAASDLFSRAGFPVHHLPLAAYYYLAHQPRVKWSTRLKHAVLAPVTAAALDRLLARERPDVVHLNSALLPGCGASAARRKIPVLWHVREVIPEDDPAARACLVGAARRHAAAIVAISEAAAAPFRPAGLVQVIHEGVRPEEWFQPEMRQPARRALGLEPEQVMVLYPAAFSRYKGQPEFLTALAGPAASALPITALLVGADGEPGFRRRLESEARRLGLSGRVRWDGWRADLPALMAAADIVAFLPAAEEGFGLALIEAMAAGRPVLSLARGAGSEVIESGRTGRLVASLDPEEVGRALAELAADPAARERLGGEARREVERRFHLDAMAASFAALFARLAESGGRMASPV